MGRASGDTLAVRLMFCCDVYYTLAVRLMDDMAALQSVHTWSRHFTAHNARRGPIVQPS